MCHFESSEHHPSQHKPVFYLFPGSGGVAYGFIGANTSRESRTKFMSYYRVTCMVGVMSSTIGKQPQTIFTCLPVMITKAINNNYTITNIMSSSWYFFFSSIVFINNYHWDDQQQHTRSTAHIVIKSHFRRFSTASATFLPNFSKNALGKATGLDEFSAPATLTILFLCVSLILVKFALDETNCSPIGEFV